MRVCLDGVSYQMVGDEWRRAGTVALYEAWWCKGGMLHLCRSRELRTLCGCSVEGRVVYVTAEGSIEEQRKTNWLRAPKELPYPWEAGPRCWKCERALLATLNVTTDRRR